MPVRKWKLISRAHTKYTETRIKVIFFGLNTIFDTIQCAMIEKRLERIPTDDRNQRKQRTNIKA